MLAVRREPYCSPAALPSVPRELVDQLAGAGIPKTYGVVETGRSDLGAIRRQGHTSHPMPMLQLKQMLAIAGVPYANGMVVPGGHDPIVRKRDPAYRAVVGFVIGRQFLARSQVPNTETAAPRTSEQLAIWRYARMGNAERVKPALDLPSRRVPQMHGRIVVAAARGDQGFAVGCISRVFETMVLIGRI